MTDKILSIDEQITLMKKYVSFRNKVKMRRFLSTVGYYRASRYGKYLISHTNTIKGFPEHNYLYNIYELDGELRNVLFKYCKIIEIEFKTTTANVVSEEKLNPCFYLDESIYTKSKGYKDKIARSRSINYFDSFMDKISDEHENLLKSNNDFPELVQYRKGGVKSKLKIPAWSYFMNIEFGSFITLYEYLNVGLQKKVLEIHYGKAFSKKQTKSIGKWLHSVRKIRNICAHHSKLIGTSMLSVMVDKIDEGILDKTDDLMSRLYAFKKLLREKDGECLKSDIKKVIKKSKINVIELKILPVDWEDKYDSIKDCN